MLSLRPYQQASVDAVFRHLRERTTDPCVVIPTAGGKSVCLAEVARKAALEWNGRVLILAHVKELVEQNAAKLKALCPELPVGVYSAGLDSRETQQPVIVAGIQSVYNKARMFRPFDLVMIDEVHMVPPDGEGRYRTFLAAAKEMNPKVRLVGWTATPFRTQGGLICKPENLLQEICYEVGVKELIDRGFISPITSKCGKAKADLEGLHVRAGEFVADEVEKAMGEERIVRTACREIVDRTKGRNSCLIFCTSVAHCRKVAKLVSEFSGEECAIVTGDTPADVRSRTIARLRGESVQTDLFGAAAPPLRFCCNVAVMTTGTDIPNVDTIALLRPTNSPGLLIQMIGRGFRLSPKTGKTECLVLDYGRNIERFGPIDMIDIREPCKGTGEALVKVCPSCDAHVRLPLMRCPECGYEFPKKEKEGARHDDRASGVGVISGEVREETYPVTETDCCVWTKRGAPPDAPRTVRVTYWVDMLHTFSEWLCPEHTGYAQRKFVRWWQEHTLPGTPVPTTAEETCEMAFAGFLRKVKSVTVRTVAGQRYPEIVGCELEEDADAEGQGEADRDGGPEDCDDIPF